MKVGSKFFTLLVFFFPPDIYFQKTPFATGFLYIKDNLQQELDPIYVSALSDEQVTNFIHKDFKPHDDAKKFQSLFNPYSLALGKTIELLNSFGRSVVEQRIFQLTDYLVEQIDKIPQFKVDSNRSDEHKSGIVRIIANNHSLNLSQIVNDLLNKHQIVVSFRENGIRVSPHFYNTFEEIDKFVKVLKSYIN